MTWFARSYPRTSCIGPGPRPSSRSCLTPGIPRGSRGFSARWSTPPSASSAHLRSRADSGRANKNAAACRGVFAFRKRRSNTQDLHRLGERVDGFLVLARLVQRSEEHTSELQSHSDLVCRLLLEKKKKK